MIGARARSEGIRYSDVAGKAMGESGIVKQ